MINPDPENIPPYRLDQLTMTFDPLIGLDTQRLIDMLGQISKATAVEYMSITKGPLPGTRRLTLTYRTYDIRI